MILLLPTASDAFAQALDKLTPGLTVSSSGSRHEVLDAMTVEQQSAVRELAARYGAVIEGAVPHLHAVLSSTQQAIPLDELVWDTLRGVAETLTFDGEYCTRRTYYRAGDGGGAPLIDVRYRYDVLGGRVVADTSTITYPYTDGTALTVEGQFYVRDYDAPDLGNGERPADGWLSW